MNKIFQTLVVVPCHSLEDFPTYYRDSDAENLLACWTAIWHPNLISATGKSPMWLRADAGEPETDDQIIVIPRVAKRIFTEASSPSIDSGNRLIDAGELTRAEIVEALLQQLPSLAAAEEIAVLDVAADFYALAYGYLQIQIMTRQLRYSSNLDEHAFELQLVAAAQAAVHGDSQTVSEKLTACFDLLLAEKNAYYPVQPDLIDLVLVAETTLGKSLSRQVTSDHRLNVLLTGSLARKLAETQAPTLAMMRERVADGSIFIAGGLENELPDALISSETIVRQLQLGKQAFQDLLSCQPEVYVRRRFGLTTSTPGLLNRAGFSGAIHASLDDGQFPESPNTIMRWTGNDGASLLAIGIPPLDAGDAGAMLRLGLRIGEQIDSSHTATVVFAHWPGRGCETFFDLLRISKFAPLLGEFTGLNDYFQVAYDPGFSEDFTADQYRDPFLHQFITTQAANPISRFIDYWQAHYRLVACTAMLAQSGGHSSSSLASTQVANEDSLIEDRKSLWRQVNELSGRLDSIVDEVETQIWRTLLDAIAELEKTVSAKVAVSLASSPMAVAGQRSDRLYLLNPTNHKQRIKCSFPGKQSPPLKDSGPILYVDSGGTQTDWVIEVAGMGFAALKLPSSHQKRSDPFRRDPAVLQDHLLRNEFFELLIDQQTGGIRSLQLYGGRNNLLSQQLAARLTGRDPTDMVPAEASGTGGSNEKLKGGTKLSKARYTTMVADDIKVRTESRIHGSITSKGRLIDGEKTVARFTQTVSLSRGVPIAEIEITIEPLLEMPHSINDYFCNRLAWKDESAQVFSNDLENQQAVISDWFLGTHYININQNEHAVTVLTNGLPFHRRASRRMIDSVLIAGNEQRRKFRLGLGVDVRYPLMTAAQWMSPQVLISADEPEANPLSKTGGNQGWFFHFDCRNVMATAWMPIYDEQQPSNEVGVQIRMRETVGRAGKLTLRCPVPIAKAERTSLSGEFIQTVPIDESKAEYAIIDFEAWEYFQIAIRW